MKTTELWMGSVGGSSPHLIGFVVSLPVKYLTSASGITGIPLEWAHCAERGRIHRAVYPARTRGIKTTTPGAGPGVVMTAAQGGWLLL